MPKDKKPEAGGQAKVLAELEAIVKTSDDDWEKDQAQRRIDRIKGQMARGAEKK